MNQFKNQASSSPEIYRTSKGWRLFFGLGIPPIIVLFGYMMLIPFFEGRANEIAYVAVCLVFGGGFAFLMLYGMITMLKWRIEVFPDRFREISLFKTREILIDDVTGFKIIPTQYFVSLQFIMKNPKTKKIKIGLMMERKQEFAEWVDATFLNLTAQETQAEINNIAQNSELGMNEEQRLDVLKRAQKWAKFINFLGYASIVWIFFPRPYTWAIGFLIMMPLIATYSMRFFGGTIKFDTKQHSAHPSVAAAFLAPCCGLALRALLDWEMLSWQSFWLPFAICSFLIFGLLLLFAQDVRKKISQILLMIVFCMSWGYGTTLSLNGILDTSVPKIYQATVLDKRVEDGKTKSYYFKLTPWGPKKGKNEVEVDRSVYGDKRIGEKVLVLVHQGYFKIPWFYAQ